MIFTLQSKQDKQLEQFYIEVMEELGQFFGFNWTKNRPKVFLVPDRKTIDTLREEKTPDWLVGWGGAINGSIFVLSPENFEAESNHRYSDEEWRALLKHELVHCFYDVVTGYIRKPKWLCEGVCTCLSGQNEWIKPVTKFEGFLDGYATAGRSAYREGGFVVEILLKKFGKEKLIELLEKIKQEKPDEKGFSKLFESVYGIKLSYQELNKLKETS